MKKLIVLLFVLLLMACTSQPTLTGYFIATVSNSQILVVVDKHGSGLISMHNNSGNESLFANLQTGDRIKVSYCGAIAYSHPGQIVVYGYELIERGSVENIPKEMYNLLIEMGWISE